MEDDFTWFDDLTAVTTAVDVEEDDMDDFFLASFSNDTWEEGAMLVAAPVLAFITVAVGGGATP